MVYNNPVAYRVDLKPEHMLELADCEWIAAIKESTGDIRRITDLRNTVGDRYQLFLGVDDLAYEGLALGCKLTAHQTRLALADRRQAIVVVGAETGLAVADEQKLGHGATIGRASQAGQRQTDVRSVCSAFDCSSREYRAWLFGIPIHPTQRIVWQASVSRSPAPAADSAAKLRCATHAKAGGSR